MDQHRAGEREISIPFRNVRYYCSNGEWFFETRNGGQSGPYESKEEMEAELLMFIRETAMVRNAITS